MATAGRSWSRSTTRCSGCVHGRRDISHFGQPADTRLPLPCGHGRGARGDRAAGSDPQARQRGSTPDGLDRRVARAGARGGGLGARRRRAGTRRRRGRPLQGGAGAADTRRVIAHWDEVEAVRRAKGPMAATWQRLGDAAGARGIAVNRIRIDPGRLSTPPHSHARAEEIFFVLSGAGLSWQDGKVCEVREGDTLVHLADHEEHPLRAGPDGLELLAFGTRHPVEYGWLPRSRAMRMGHVWTEGRDDDPWDIEAEVGGPQVRAP